MQYITKDGWIISEEIYNQILDICPVLNFNEVLRLVDLVKSGLIDK